jgi:hypothetical protein
MINKTLTKEYPKLLETVNGNTSQEEKLKAVHEFIELLDILVKEIENGNVGTKTRTSR